MSEDNEEIQNGTDLKETAAHRPEEGCGSGI